MDAAPAHQHQSAALRGWFRGLVDDVAGAIPLRLVFPRAGRRLLSFAVCPAETKSASPALRRAFPGKSRIRVALNARRPRFFGFSGDDSPRVPGTAGGRVPANF